MTILKSIVAVAGGIAAFSIALVGINGAGTALLGGDPEWINRSVAAQLAWLAWNIVSMIGGGYVTAWLAPKAPVAHAVTMGTLQACFTLAAMMTVTGDATPRWLSIGGIASTIPSAWAGVRVRARSRVRG